MKRFVIRFFASLFAIVFLAIAYVGVTLLRANGGLPEWNGDLSDAGLQAKVEVVRNQHGIPFIDAETERDLYFAQGFVHAQDRFWQMAFTRRAISGRLAEWVGAPAVRGDRISRMFGWMRMAKESLDALPDEDRALLESYAHGVNAWLDSEFYRRPPEMVVLHVEPERWRAEDAFVIAYSIHQMFSASGSERVKAILNAGGATPNAHEIFDEEDLFVLPIIATSKDEPLLQPTAAYETPTFSDNWTLSGQNTTTGMPLMANDPQIRLSLPGPWHLQHHTIGNRQVVGGTLPGAPGVAVGHNNELAWGITMAGIDARDFAYLQIDPNDSDRYRRGPDTAWLSFDQSVETIKVRFADDIVETIRRTPQGAVWPAGLNSLLIGEQQGLALEINDVAAQNVIASPSSFILLNRAQSVNQGIAAVEGMVAPSVNLSLADIEGNIGYVTTGRVPLRPRSHATNVGLFPDDNNEWELLPYDGNPKLVNPPNGRIVTANQRIIGDEYPHYLTDRWAPPTRANRVHEVLDTKSQHDTASFVAMQSESFSTVARDLVPLMLKVELSGDEGREILEILSEWDYQFSLESAAPLIWLTWTETIRSAMLSDELGSAPMYFRFAPLQRALSGERAEWCDNANTDDQEDCATILKSSLLQARDKLTSAYGANPDDWQWGTHAQFKIPHQGFAGIPILDGMFSRSTPIPGGPQTLFRNQVRTRDAPKFSATNANSSYQGVYDLSDLDSSLFMMPGGSSGHFRSPFYNNLTPLWVDGQRMGLSRDDLEVEATLTLNPSANNN